MYPVDTNSDADRDLMELQMIWFPEDDAPVVGPNCRIDVADRDELFRVTEELEDLQRWFEEYGQDGILFPNSIINAFPAQTSRQAA